MSANSTFSVAILTNGIFSKPLWVILIASLILFGIGILDDFKEVSAGIKLLAQLVCTLLVMSCGIVLRVLPADLGLIAIIGNSLLTVFWIIGITNAMNFFDGMDGLAAGLGAWAH
jgi:UDP-GlcNAc:undecaprenyl-phosphate GlcNAc-1-phosphate transferase